MNIYQKEGDEATNKAIAIIGCKSSMLTVKLEEGTEYSDGNVVKYQVRQAGDAAPVYSLADLKFGKVLGEGFYGKVSLVKCKVTQEIYALKALNKRQIINENQTQQIISEKNIMADIDHPFIVNLVASFQDKNQAYLVMPVYKGGSLFSIMHPKNCTKKRRHRLPIESVRFYGSCVLDSLHYLQQRCIAHRDLKPENIMIDDDGYCVLIDFGCAKVMTQDKTYTICGTCEYMAPEILTGKGHSFSVDCWAFAVLVFEMLVGKSPFTSKSELKILKKIIKVKYKSHSRLNQDTEHFMNSIFRSKCSDRLGYGKQGVRDLKEHNLFQCTDWKKLATKKLDAPWMPDAKDTSTLNSVNEFGEMYEKPRNFGKELSQSEQLLFKGF